MQPALVDELRQHGVEAQSIADGFDHAGLLLQEAPDRGPGMIAVGYHGRWGVAPCTRSVSLAVVQRSRIPVIVAGPQWGAER